MNIASGQVLGHGRFEVLAPIGEGGMGVVYEVKDRASETRLALKTVRNIGPEGLVSLKREFRAAHDLAHPNLVRLDELFEEDGAWFFTMELIDGKDFLSYVGEGEHLDENRLRTTLVDIVEALSELHARGFVHRDVKPSNVLVSRDGRVKLLDFGIVSPSGEVLEPRDEHIAGTVVYLSPEQLRFGLITPACDFYALGVMLHQALTGHLPFFDRLEDISHEKLTAEPTPVRDIADVPPDLAELCDALLQSSPVARPDAAAILRMLGESRRSSRPPELFVGREQELAELGAAYAALRAGATTTIIVNGTSGIGKSALVRHFLDSLRFRALTLSGRCHEREHVPYKAIDAIVDELAIYLARSHKPDSPLRTSAVPLLGRLFPALRRATPESHRANDVTTPGGGITYEFRSRVFQAFRELLSEVGKTQDLVLSIDDIQWADADSLALLAELLAPPSPPRLLLVCTRRISEDSMGQPIPLFLPGDVRRLTLTGLPNGDVQKLASQLSQHTQLSAATLEELAKESGGHPLFLQELMRLSAEGHYAAPQVRLEDAIWSRIAALTGAERALIEIISLAAIATPVSVIAQAASMPLKSAKERLLRLRDMNLVRLSAARENRQVELYHHRIGEVVMPRMDAETKRAWHEQLARALEQHVEQDVERLAVHWEGAGELLRAGRLYEKAAQRASATLAFERAAQLYGRCLSLSQPQASQRAELERMRAEALLNAGHGGEAGHALVVAANLRSGYDAIELRGRAANAFLVSGHLEEGAALLKQTLKELGVTLPSGRFGIIMKLLWHRLMLQLRGFDLKRREPNPSPVALMRADVCWFAAHGLAMTDAVRGGAMQALNARLSLGLGDVLRAARSLCAYAISISWGGERARKLTLRVIKAARALCQENPNPYTDALADAADGFSAFMREDWESARAYFVKSEACFRDRCVGVSYELATIRFMLDRVLGSLGRFVELESHSVPILRDAIRRNDLLSIVNIRATAGVLVALMHDDLPRAERDLQDVERALFKEGLQLQKVYCLVSRINVDLYRGAPETALARVEGNRKAFRGSLARRVQSIRVMYIQACARTHIAAAEHNIDARAQQIQAALRSAHALEREGLPASRAFAALTRAACAALQDDAQRAKQLLAQALNAFEAIDMALYAAAIRLILAIRETRDEAQPAPETPRYFQEQAIVSPERFIRMVAPGFGV